MLGLALIMAILFTSIPVAFANGNGGEPGYSPGYWKHQCKASFLGRGRLHETELDDLAASFGSSVEEAYGAGCDIDEKLILDRVLLPDVHEEVYETALGARNPLVSDALGIFETLTVASLLRAADAATKGAQVGICELRMADDLGGRAFVLFHGLIADVEAALEICEERVEPEQVHGCTILPRLDATLRSALNAETRFILSKPLEPEGAETHAHR